MMENIKHRLICRMVDGVWIPVSEPVPPRPKKHDKHKKGDTI
jgi:hypothetical protein